ncbi:MAG: HAD-IA family hydrolase [Candidatus Heimdallarchaeota archaeon]|nr:HAD-IA family hydrolase [Candidatus Heimdallarchaeota archaeon]
MEKDTKGDLHAKAWEIVEKAEQLGYEDAEIENDVHSTLTKLRANNHKIAIFTNNSRKLTDYGMLKFDLNKYTECIITRDDVEYAKPNPEGLLKIMNYNNVSKDQTIFIGDSWLDAETAQFANVDFIYYGERSAPGTCRKKIEVSKIINKISEVLDYV